MDSEKTISLSFTAQRLDYIANVLAQRPYAEVHPVLADIQAQVSQQQNNPVSLPNGDGAALAPH